MNLKSFMQLCVAFNILIGCYIETDAESYDALEEEQEEQDKTFEEKEPEVSTSVPDKKQEKTDKGFDACPSDTYVLWEKDGIKYVITIEVFCDPIKNSINLGCPAPF